MLLMVVYLIHSVFAKERHIDNRVVSSPFGLKYFLGLSPYFEVIERALSLLRILAKGLGINHFQ